MSVVDKLTLLRGVTWAWNGSCAPLGKQPGARDAGVIAQEVDSRVPGSGRHQSGYKQVNCAALVGLRIATVQELKADNDALRKRIEQLEQAAEPK